MNKNYIKNTDLLVSKIGIGTVRFGRNKGLKFSSNIPSDEHLKNFLINAKELGINYLDTAPAYGSSEERLGKLLYRDRHNWVISSKVGESFDNETGRSIYNYGYEFIIEDIFESLRRLKTDYLDIVFVHSNGDIENRCDRWEIYSALRKMKEQGYVRYTGWSLTDKFESDLSIVDVSDVIMLTHNKNSVNTKVLKHCRELGKSIIVKKPLDSGNIDAKKGYNYILKTNYNLEIASILTGTLNIEHLKQAIRSVDEYYSIH